MLPNPYLPTVDTRDTNLQLICLPYAGGGSAVFHRWRAALPTGIDVLPICLPGRETRINERPRTNMATLVGEIADAITPQLEQPFALLGHSMGALIAFELARELRRRDLPLPRLLVEAACTPPHLPRGGAPLHNLPDAELVAEIERRFHGIPEAVRDDQELLDLVMPMLRADFQLFEDYQFVEERPLDVDLVVIGGTEDPNVSAGALSEWRRHTTGNFSVRLFPGGHFFPFPASGAFPGESTWKSSVRVVGQQLERCIAK